MADIKQAAEFLRLLNTEDNRFHFEAKHSSREPVPIIGAFADYTNFASSLEMKGYDVSVVVNKLRGPDRKAENVTGIRAVWHVDEGRGFVPPLEPSAVLCVGPRSYHYYWFVDGLGPHDFDAIMDAMVHRWGSSSGYDDRAQAMVLPGFTLGNVIVQTRQLAAIRYTPQQLKDAFTGEEAESLTERAIKDLREAFASRPTKHNPSEDMWKAIADVARTVERMSKGQLDKGKFYVSSLDPGVGKTQTIVHAIRNLPKDVGVLICVSRLQEIASLIASMGLAPDEVGVFTGDDETNKLGDDPNSKRVMFTTQQMVDSRLRDGKHFGSLQVFHFRDEPRQVRIWDEAMLPGLELTVNVDAIAALPRLLRKRHFQLTEWLLDLVQELRKAKDGYVYSFDLEKEFGVRLADLAATMQGWDKAQRDALETLCRMSGKSVSVRHDSGGNTILDYREHLPDDFAPVLILDASARVRATYHYWEKSRGNLQQLAKANKRYDNLTIHHWDTGGGKNAFRENHHRLIEGIAATINTKPTEQWLVVIHKDDGKDLPDLRQAIGALVQGDPNRVQYLTWGNHHATNEYIDIENVILAGTLFYPPSVYDVRARASMAHPAEKQLAREDYRAIELGEHAHLILQAACRGSVRRCEGHQCAPCNLYLIAAARTGIGQHLEAVFPGHKSKRWTPVAKPLRGKVKQAIEFIDRQLLSDDPNRVIRIPDVMREIGIPNRSNYNRVIGKHYQFEEALQKRGIVVVAEKAYSSGYQRRPF